MKQYELLVVLPGTQAEAEVSQIIGSVKEIVEKNGGEHIVTHDRGKSRLAYPIRHIRYGYFHLIRFTAEGDTIPRIQKELALMPEFLRTLITSFDPVQRAETQKKLGRTEEGPLRTLASVFERFGGELKKGEEYTEERRPVAHAPIPSTIQTKEPDVQETDGMDVPVMNIKEKPKKEKRVVAMEDIEKKLDQLLEDDLKQV
ncbi:MAG: 30S ribosomal protein S6 [Candidatus Magasanikbacteria bacterium CG11_big_fil_rev_8_21_14_0_20_43_7]|uniref:Small ribosomal subunit protein bS6 n=1 Tax=Candidatus Magasanikbacteria bacterium CG11_big_fil_rev_8_21_14_0_20_43_7 TaxID=1974654 RepID=A0A2H0N563_9BACT|nr:MAG: 30S ribosomal protein S6 [Candidatus Magasanikbacteria bacterium CG11_big_fil_rev_8_21_14_0_20_43_7]